MGATGGLTGSVTVDGATMGTTGGLTVDGGATGGLTVDSGATVDGGATGGPRTPLLFDVFILNKVVTAYFFK